MLYIFSEVSLLHIHEGLQQRIDQEWRVLEEVGWSQYLTAI